MEAVLLMHKYISSASQKAGQTSCHTRNVI